MDETFNSPPPPHEPQLPPEAVAAGITPQEWADYIAAQDAPGADRTTNATLAYEIFGDKAEAFLKPGVANASESTKNSRVSSGRPNRPGYRAHRKDFDDNAARAYRQGVEGEGPEPSDEEIEAGREVADFAAKFYEQHGTYQIQKYVDGHPEDTELAQRARELGLIK